MINKVFDINKDWVQVPQSRITIVKLNTGRLEVSSLFRSPQENEEDGLSIEFKGVSVVTAAILLFKLSGDFYLILVLSSLL